MTQHSTLQHPILSLGLVALQFSLIALLSYLLISQSHNRLELLPTAALIGYASAVILGLWAVKTMRLGKFNIVPDPQQNVTLITSGPYRYIRHPMYLSILIFFLPPALFQPSFSVLLTYGLLAFTLVIKLHYEERLLRQALSSYSHYQARSKKLIPFIY